ncbi:hypothetical protein HZH66_008608 [Vespula vulgaris]|uniref:Uncharacterized protein n=1 Tax=Vespula vulgaris TaxID=7454 RepID=A0A834N127_VESVU|nr:hypothetical protein HZH66_008608 [Vespula vulgaris]
MFEAPYVTNPNENGTKKKKKKKKKRRGEKEKKIHGESQLARSFERNDRIRSRNGEGPLPRSNKFEGREGKDLSNGMTFPPGSDSVRRGIERERKTGKRKRTKKRTRRSTRRRTRRRRRRDIVRVSYPSTLRKRSCSRFRP